MKILTNIKSIFLLMTNHLWNILWGFIKPFVYLYLAWLSMNIINLSS